MKITYEINISTSYTINIHYYSIKWQIIVLFGAGMFLNVLFGGISPFLFLIGPLPLSILLRMGNLNSETDFNYAQCFRSIRRANRDKLGIIIHISE